MAVFVLEDLQAACEVMVFPKTMDEHGHKLDDDAVVCVKARVDTREDAPSSSPWSRSASSPRPTGPDPLQITVPTRFDDDVVVDLRELLLPSTRGTEVCSWSGATRCVCPTTTGSTPPTGSGGRAARDARPRLPI